jgi:hypothetical protein
VRVNDRTQRAVIGVAAYLEIVAAVVVAILAWTFYELICDEGCSTSHPYRTWQLVLALVAVAPMVGSGRCLLLRQRRAALGLFAVALVLYAS